MKEKKHIVLPLVLVSLVVIMIFVFAGMLFLMGNRETEDDDGYDFGMYDVGRGIEADVAWYQAGQDSYYISTMEELAGLSRLVNEGNAFEGKTIYLTNDLIDSERIDPIGTKMHPFSGRFDGMGYKVMYTYDLAEGNNAYGGMFGYTEGAEICNVGVLAASFLGTEANGGLIGYAVDTDIKQCFFDGDILASGANTGGLVGYAEGCRFEGCYTTGFSNGTGTISYGDDAFWGGFVGYAKNCEFNCCFSDVDAGYMGENVEYSPFGVAVGKAVDCKAEQFYFATENGYMKGCGTGEDLPKGFIEITGYEMSVLKALQEMNANGEAQWQYEVSSGGSYMHVIEPRLQSSHHSKGEVYSLDNSVLGIAGEYVVRPATEKELQQYGTEEIIEIETAPELAAVVVDCMQGNSFAGTTILLMDDLDLEGYQWLPLGNYYAADNGIMGQSWDFCGNIDGLGHKIKNLYIHTGNGTCGFVGQSGYGNVRIQNLTIENCYIRGAMYVSGMVGSDHSTDLVLYNNRVSGRIEGNFSSAFATMCGNVYLEDCEAKVTLKDGGESEGLTVRSGVINTKNCSYTEIP
ncbi:MAG: hypothetical protein J6K37_04395 [Lachnospiraceae bacterium]|nr:hypothetical protein [Lachnospiraceae bacterium]